MFKKPILVIGKQSLSKTQAINYIIKKYSNTCFPIIYSTKPKSCYYLNCSKYIYITELMFETMYKNKTILYFNEDRTKKYKTLVSSSDISNLAFSGKHVIVDINSDSKLYCENLIINSYKLILDNYELNFQNNENIFNINNTYDSIKKSLEDLVQNDLY